MSAIASDFCRSRFAHGGWIVLAVLGYYLIVRDPLGFRSESAEDVQVMMGTWTDGKGKPGNRIRFHQVPCNLPSTAVGLDGFEGRAEFLKHFGKNNLETTWNYENWDPLRINISVDRYQIAAIEVLDFDHMRIRFAELPEQVNGENPLNHPDTMLLTRVQDDED